MNSPFQNERAQYQPVVPNLLKGLKTLSFLEGVPTAAIGDVLEIQEHFPSIFQKPILRFETGTTNYSSSPLKVGVVLSGGQAAGGHNVIAGLYDALKTLHKESSLYGFLGGPSGVIDGKMIELTEQKIASYRNMGGFDLIGSGRTKIETPEQLAASLKVVLTGTFDGLVIVGGDDSNTNAAVLAQYFLKHNAKTCVIGVPKTIDGDLKNAFIESSFGFDTATKVYSEMISNISRDALSAKKYTHFVKLMGRSASHVALECALQTHPNLTIIGEEIDQLETTLSQIVHQIADVVSQRAARGKDYGVILIPEGLIEFIPEMNTLIAQLNCGELNEAGEAILAMLPPAISKQLQMERDPHGNVQVSHIETEKLLISLVQDELSQRSSFKGKFSPVHHFFGYEGRSAYPTNFDACYTYALGMSAAVLIDRKITGYMAMVSHLTKRVEQWGAGGIPITMMMHMEERKGKMKPVICKAQVDLDSEPFRTFTSLREKWALDDDYRYQGPIQYFGPPNLCDETTLTLKLENNVPIFI